MGFTFSHPVLILPLRYLPRKTYSLNGLVIGSMIPDLEYFIRLDNESNHSHTFSGIIWFDIPMAILVSIVFHQLVRDTLIRNLPLFLQQRFYRFLHTNWLGYLKDNWLIVCYSIAAGALTHMFWDNFTSAGGYFVVRNKVFVKEYMILGFPVHIYQVIKYSSSLLAIIILIRVVLSLPRSYTIPLKKDKPYWFLVATFFVLLLMIRLFITDQEEILSYNLIKTSISCGLLSILLTSLFFLNKHSGFGAKSINTKK